MVATREHSSPHQLGVCGGRGWGFLATEVDDATKCIRECREKFLKGLLLKNETFERVCEVLEDQTYMSQDQPFRNLYCCDAQFCGVNSLKSRGKDPNVNWFITACQNIGHSSVIDPGPPVHGVLCPSDSLHSSGARCQKELPAPVVDKSSQTSRMPSDSVLPASRTTLGSLSDESAKAAGVTQTKAIARSDSHSSPQTSTGTSDASFAASRETAGAENQHAAEHHHQLATGAKVGIVVASLVGLIAILVALWLLRRRARRTRQPPEQDKHQSFPPPADSPTPLVSPGTLHTNTDGAPMTPPARLKERRFLIPAPKERALQDRLGFPLSPLYSPTTGELTPRLEQTAFVLGQAPAVRTRSDGRLSSPGRIASHTSSRSTPQIYSPTASEHRGVSPTRPVRPYEAPLSLHSLVSPGPPPNRALPTTPTGGQHSPAKVQSFLGGTGLDLGTQQPPLPRLDAEHSQDHRGLGSVSESPIREGCNSWGSWGGEDNGRGSK